MKTVLAIMQNMWVKDPIRAKKLIEKWGDEYRRTLIEYALFAGCLTGRRLKKAFGDDLCNHIIWDESTREIGGDYKTIFPAQPEHIKAIISEVRPFVVLTFGGIATKATQAIYGTSPEGFILYSCPHPAARQPETMDRLIATARQIEMIIK